jgi:polar amino acid transport system ATP-binding protein/sulfate transport system ATP-binding protein
MNVEVFERKETILHVEGVSLRFGDNLILRDVNIDVKNIVRPGLNQGQVVGLLGPSGIGKTQLFRIMAGLQPPTSGQVTINAHSTPVSAGLVGVVSQNYRLFPWRTTIGNLLVAGSQAGLSKKAALEKAKELLQRFSLYDRRLHYPAQLSGGQRQRIAIAQQLMCSEHFLLMDEPFSGLDIVAKAQVCGLIAEVAAMDELNTIIVVSHDIETTSSIADTVWLLGLDRDADGNFVSGARIQEVYDLAAAGLAWHKDITLAPEFADFVRQIRIRFSTLR